MNRKRLIWQLWPSYLVIVVISIAAVALYSGRALRRTHYASTQEKLLAVARIIAADFAAAPERMQTDEAQPRGEMLARESGLRVTLVRRSGAVVADSEEHPTRMDNHGDRPEIRDAWRGAYGVSVRRSGTVKKDMMYVAVPIVVDGKRVASARVSLSLASIDASIQVMFVQLALAGLGFIVVAGALSIFMARRLSLPLQRIRQWAVDFAEGREGGRIPASPITEIDILSNTMNSMADQLNERIDQIKRQRDEQDALFGCMGEGVLAVDNDKHLIKLNESAARLFSLDRDRVRGQSIINVIRNADLHELMERTLTQTEPVEGLLHILEKDKYLQVHGSALTGPQGARIGALLVLNDVTQLRKLETMRRDFVANVSHELKTPITSIKGFSETLLDSDGESAEERAHFLGIIARQADRLQTIVEDLLTLSSIEYADDTAATLELQECRVLPVLESAVRSCQIAAESKNITVNVDCPDDLRARLNVAFMEQAVINLIDNAIKYSEQETTVQVSAALDAGYVRLSVSDEGPGIAELHIERIFERFYRVDKSRSRKLGGTGLGLAIVKRIAIFHGGAVHAMSKVGEGSTFTITLPVI